MKRVLYRDEPFFYTVGWRGSDFLCDRRYVVTVFRKRTGFLSLFRPYVVLNEGVVAIGTDTIPATLKRVLKEIADKESPEPPLLIECSKEIEELYKS